MYVCNEMNKKGGTYAPAMIITPSTCSLINAL